MTSVATMTKTLNIFFFSIEAIGHMNSSIGIGQVLRDAGHRITFVISNQWKGKLVRYGFHELIIPVQTKPDDKDPTAHWADMFLNGGAMEDVSPLEIMISIWTKLVPGFMHEAKQVDPLLDDIIRRERPDLFILDQAQTIPAIELSGIPWIYSCSFNPLRGVDDKRAPPGFSGLSIYSDPKEWKKFRDGVNEATGHLSDQWNQYVVSRGLPPLEKYASNRPSSFMNIYGFPLELDYLDVITLPSNWQRFDNLKRTEPGDDFQVPEVLKNKPGKLVYFSMGTIGGGDLRLMKRLIGILGESKHRFIVSKGPLHDRYELADNMWGQQSVPQISVLPVVDLVITHGGNNTVTETFFFGKPMIILPIFGDQFDNAVRIHEKNLGLSLDPHKCTKEELLNGIDNLLNDKELNEKLKNISKRIQSDRSIEKLPKLIEQRLVDWKNDNKV